jgi:hypothetical protein
MMWSGADAKKSIPIKLILSISFYKKDAKIARFFLAFRPITRSALHLPFLRKKLDITY